MKKRLTGSPANRIFDIVNAIFLSLVVIITLYPFYYVLIASVSDGSQIIQGNVIFTPKDFTLAAYEQVPKIKYFWKAYANSLFITFFGALASMVVMSMGAYALSRNRLKGRRVISLIISCTLWFNAGMIPIYLNMDSLGLVNSRFGVIIGFLCNAFYIVIMRTYFEGLPTELEESARLDGLSNFQIFLWIMLPLSKPMLATVSLYCVVDRWNSYLWSMILLKDPEKVPLQVLLKKLIIENKILAEVSSGGANTTETLIYAVIVMSIIPIIAAYPFAQKFFEKGLTVGAVKG